MKKRKIKITDLTDEQRLELLSKRRIKVLSKYINKHYLKNEKWMKLVGTSLSAIIKYEIVKGLDEEFDILRDDPDDPLILELVEEKTQLIIQELYKDNGTSRKN